MVYTYHTVWYGRMDLMSVTKQEWIDTGLRSLEHVGTSGLTIDQMAKELGVTKGSFYHHFTKMRDFEERLVEYWANQYLQTPERLPDTPDQRLALLDTIMDEVFSQITGPEIAIRTWAQRDEFVYKFVNRVDEARRNFVLSVFESFCDSEYQAQLMADMFFTLAIGSITALPRIPSGRVVDLYREFKRLYALE